MTSRVVLASVIALAVTAATGAGAAQAVTCTFTPEPSPFFRITATKTSCSKAQSLGKAWANKKSCHSSESKSKATWTVKEFKLHVEDPNLTGAAHEAVTCKNGTAVVKFIYGFG